MEFLIMIKTMIYYMENLKLFVAKVFIARIFLL